VPPSRDERAARPCGACRAGASVRVETDRVSKRFRCRKSHRAALPVAISIEGVAARDSAENKRREHNAPS